MREQVSLIHVNKDEEMPTSVQAAIDFLDSLHIWRVISRNSPATSCRDAASRRIRLGTRGIPLADELKSACVVFYDRDGKRHYVLLHCRANLRFDMERVGALLNASRPLARLAPEELQHVFGSQYGTVNPFIKMDKVLVQVFDRSLLVKYSPPHTMMTNAGEHTWAIEFRPDELVKSLSSAYPTKVIVEHITHAPKDRETRRFTLGIVTGNGPESGISLWRHVNRFVREGLGDGFNGDLSYPPVVVHSIPEMGLSMELDHRQDEVWQHLSNGVRQLCEKGATHIALACHTTHFFSEQMYALCAEYSAEFVSMATTVIDAIQAENISDITVIGIPYVADLGEWSAYRGLSSLNVHPVNEKARQPLLELGYLIKKTGSDSRGLSKLQHILRIGVQTEYVLIALTEISVLLEGFPKKQTKIGQWKIIDPLLLYGKKLAQIYVKYLAHLTDGDGGDEEL